MMYFLMWLIAIVFPVLKEMHSFAGQLDVTAVNVDGNIDEQAFPVQEIAPVKSEVPSTSRLETYPQLDKIIDECIRAFQDVLTCSISQNFRAESLEIIDELPVKIDQILASESEREKAKHENERYWHYRLLKAVFEKNSEEITLLLRHTKHVLSFHERGEYIFDFLPVFFYVENADEGMKILKLLAMHGVMTNLRYSDLYFDNREDYLSLLEAWLIPRIQQATNFQFKSNAQPGSTGYAYFEHNAQRVIINGLNEMINKGIDPDAKRVKDLDGYKHPLTQVFQAYIAAAEEYKPFFSTIIDMLIERGATIDEALLTKDVLDYFSDYEGLGRLLRARNTVARNVIDKLQLEGFDFSQKSQEKRTLLHWACMTPGQINRSRDKECRPLDPEAVGALLKTGVDIYAQDRNNKTAWDYVFSFPLENVEGAVARGREAMEPAEEKLIKIFFLLLKMGYEPNPAEDYDLVDAARNLLKADQETGQ